MTTVNFYDKEQTDALLADKANSAEVYSKEQIDEKNIGAPDDTASASGSLWARIKNALSRIGILETADTNNVKKTGTSTVTGTLEVPTTPPTPTSAVNSVYVNDATSGVNNIMHKSGVERIEGNKTFVNALYLGASTTDISQLYALTDANGSQRTDILATSTTGDVTGILELIANADGTLTLRLQKRKADGTYITQTVITTL